MQEPIRGPGRTPSSKVAGGPYTSDLVFEELPSPLSVLQSALLLRDCRLTAVIVFCGVNRKARKAAFPLILYTQQFWVQNRLASTSVCRV
jgi:hypothetical protein